MTPERIILKNTQSPGDLIVLTAAIRDISLAYPGRFEFMINTSAPQVFAHNPYLKHFPRGGVREIKANYPLIHKCNQERRHFIWGFLEDLNNQLDVKAPLTDLKPDLHLSEQEKEPFKDIPRPYWVMVSGGKLDFTAKWWHPKYWQKVVDNISKDRAVVQVGSTNHQHPRLKNVVDMVGKTTMRDLFRLIYHAEGVMCIVTCLGHIAAAFNKSCVWVAGGREPWWWEAYTAETRAINIRHSNPTWKDPEDGYISQKYLHTMGRLACCQNKGCWKSHIGKHRGSLCTSQVMVEKITLPRCMQMITPDCVIDAVRGYWDVNKQPVTETLDAITLPEILNVTEGEIKEKLQDLNAVKQPWVVFSKEKLSPELLEALQKESLGVDGLGCWYKTAGAYLPKPTLFGFRTECVRLAGLAETEYSMSGVGAKVSKYVKDNNLTWKDIGKLILKAGF